MTDGQASISTDILARYAADAACEVPGVAGLVERHLPGRRGVRVLREGARVDVELHVTVARDASRPDVGRAVQARVREYLSRIARLDEVRVDVAIDELAEEQ